MSKKGQKNAASTQQSIEKAMSQFSHHRRNLPVPIFETMKIVFFPFFPFLFNLKENIRQHLSNLNWTVEHVEQTPKSTSWEKNQTPKQKKKRFARQSNPQLCDIIFIKLEPRKILSATVDMLGCVTWRRERKKEKSFPITVEGEDSLRAGRKPFKRNDIVFSI